MRFFNQNRHWRQDFSQHVTSGNDSTLYSTTPSNVAPVRVAVLQRILPGYRLELFRQLSAAAGIELRVFIGDDIPNTKWRSAGDLSGVDVVRLKTRFIRLRSRLMPWHKGLRRELANFRADVILAEGESNFLSYLQALWFRRSHRSVKMMHWGGGGIPGQVNEPFSVGSRFKLYMQKKFDGLMVYSTFCKNWLVEAGHDEANIAVAVNVGNTVQHLSAADGLDETQAQARERLGLGDRFTVFYVGAMDANKRPDVLLDLAETTDSSKFDFVLAGDGPEVEPLKQRAANGGLDNVYVLGRVSDDLPSYYKASDVVIIPGRGGIVISEAMAWRLPVLVHEADGTEHDLVKDGVTGRILESGSVDDFKEVIESMEADPEGTRQLGENGRSILESDFTVEQYAASVKKAILDIASQPLD
jgi:glycosyltransferase involved in cell wall biosynthesis